MHHGIAGMPFIGCSPPVTFCTIEMQVAMPGFLYTHLGGSAFAGKVWLYR